jgi:cobalt-precorrin-5B (C1)-methyltransferase
MENRTPSSELRRGWTTGACASAAAAAAYRALLTGIFPRTVSVRLPRGQAPEFELSLTELGENRARAGVIKDAGDDPDVTHGAEIIATVRQGDTGSGIRFLAGEGVGTVTLPGLPLQVGEPAINPMPRQIMENAIGEIAREFKNSGDVEITISIPGGEELAKKTMNGRLGIKGGLSVLGTTGIVIPFSCSSWIHSIHRGIDVARAAGLHHVAAATGSTSEKAVRDKFALSEQALIDMGDFAGGLLKYLGKHPLPQLTIAGGFGKLGKLAQGNLDLHSSRSQLDMKQLAVMAKEVGADDALAEAISSANTGLEALEFCLAAHVPLAGQVAKRAREVAMAALSGGTEVQVLVYDRQGELVGQSANLFGEASEP